MTWSDVGRPRSLRLLFMSGTGNTRRVALWMRERALTRGVTAEAEAMTNLSPRRVRPGGGGALLGLLFPTHGFTAPWAGLRFAALLPRGWGTSAFVAATRGGSYIGRVRLPGLEGTGPWLVALILLLKGYRVRGVTAVDMPSNWTALHSALADWKQRVIVGRARARTEAFSDALLDGGHRFGGLLPLLLGLALAPVSLGYLAVGRFWLAKIFFADERCTSCGLCQARCPFGAVRLRGARRPVPYWSWKCESCMRCMAICPERAIQAGHSWSILLIWIAVTVAAPVLAVVVGLLPPRAAPWVMGFLPYLLHLTAILAVYPLFWWLMRVPLVNLLFARTTFTRLYRRYLEPDTKVADLAPAVPGGIDMRAARRGKSKILPTEGTDQ